MTSFPSCLIVPELHEFGERASVTTVTQQGHGLVLCSVTHRTQITSHITPPSKASHVQGSIPTPQPGGCWAGSRKDFSEGYILSPTASLVTNTVMWKYFWSQICSTDSLHLCSSALELLFFPSTERHKKFQNTFAREHAKATATFS